MGVMRRCGRLGVVLAALAAGSTAWAQTAEQPPAPAAPQETQAAGRALNAIMGDFQAAAEQLGQIVSSPSQVTDAAMRAEVGPKAIPILRRMLGLADELAASDPRGAMMAGAMKPQMLGMLSVFGEAEATAAIDEMIASSDARIAAQGKALRLATRWIHASGDGAAQTALLTDAAALARDNPESPDVLQALMQMSQLGAATPDLGEKLQLIVVENMKGPQVEVVKSQLDAERTLRGLVGQPLVLAGPLHDGTAFSTDAMKGKVILVDFWATWCGPCKVELPRVKKVYADYHAQGLEVLGVSCDESADALKAFLAENPDMPWPQMFDAAKPGWHALATQYGVNGIPTMFLIDRKGVVRSVTARENFEEMIPKLLAEPAE